MALSDDYDAMRRTVFGEARGEPFEGQIAVAWVILNRARHPTTNWWGRGVVGVCFAPKQFSCWNTGDPNGGLARVATENSRSLLQASAAAAGVLTGAFPDPTSGSTHYYADHIVPPGWTDHATFTVKIGHHLFFKDVP